MSPTNIMCGSSNYSVMTDACICVCVCALAFSIMLFVWTCVYASQKHVFARDVFRHVCVCACEHVCPTAM